MKKINNLMIIGITLSIISAILVFFTQAVQAQGVNLDVLPPEMRETLEHELTPEELEEFKAGTGEFARAATGVDCSSFQNFMSVKMNIMPEKGEYAPGEEIDFTGEIINENAYPLVDGNLFVKISKKNPNSNLEGNFIIEEMNVAAMSLKGQEQKLVNFKWNIPKDISAGTYQVDYFFNLGNKYYLNGDPLLSTSSSNPKIFKINASNQNYVSFEKNQTQINGEQYLDSEEIPVAAAKEKVTFTQVLKSTFREAKQVKITYDLYQNNSLDEKNKISSKQETINLSGDESRKLVYEIPSLEGSVYWLKVTALTGTQKSILNLPVMSDQGTPQLRFSALNQFPLKKGNEAVLFACFNNTALNNFQGKVLLTLEDESGKKVGEMEYEGPIGAQLLADKADLDLKKDYDQLKLIAQIINEEGDVVDSYETVYDAEALAQGTSAVVGKSDERDSSQSGIIILAIMAVLVILIVILIIKYMRHNKNSNGSGRSGVISLALFLFASMIFSLILLACSGRVAQADVIPQYNDKTETQEVTCSSYHFSMSDIFGWSGKDGAGFWCTDTSLSVYHAIRMTQGEFNAGVGDDFSFAYEPYEAPRFKCTGHYEDGSTNGGFLVLAEPDGTLLPGGYCAQDGSDCDQFNCQNYPGNYNSGGTDSCIAYAAGQVGTAGMWALGKIMSGIFTGFIILLTWNNQ